MHKYILMSFDLEGYVSEEARKRVYTKLRDLNWTPVPELTTVWIVSFKGTSTHDTAVRIAKNDLVEAARAGYVSQYHAIVMSSDFRQTEFSNEG
jgi:hypothetical protein